MTTSGSVFTRLRVAFSEGTAPSLSRPLIDFLSLRDVVLDASISPACPRYSASISSSAGISPRRSRPPSVSPSFSRLLRCLPSCSLRPGVLPSIKKILAEYLPEYLALSRVSRRASRRESFRVSRRASRRESFRVSRRVSRRYLSPFWKLAHFDSFLERRNNTIFLISVLRRSNVIF